MKKGNINIGFADVEGRDVLLITVSDPTQPTRMIRRELPEVEREGFAGLCHIIGYTALRMLSRAHPDVFAKYPLINPPEPLLDTAALFHALFALSIRERTGKYVSAIDALLARDDPALAQTDIREHWPDARSRLLEFPQ